MGNLCGRKSKQKQNYTEPHSTTRVYPKSSSGSTGSTMASNNPYPKTFQQDNLGKRNRKQDGLHEFGPPEPKKASTSKSNIWKQPAPKPKKTEISFAEVYPSTSENDSPELSAKFQHFDMDWTDAEYMRDVHSSRTYYDLNVITSVINLFKNDNTIPFIARYQRNITGGLEAEELRALKESYDRAKTIKTQASKIITKIDKLGKWTPEVHAVVKSAKSLNDLEHINSLYKVSAQKSLAEKARELGLDELSQNVFNGLPIPSLYAYCDPTKPGIKTQAEVKTGIINILADMISKNKIIFDKVQELRKTYPAQIQVTVKNLKQREDETPEQAEKLKREQEKFAVYFNFKSKSDSIKPHQILAINRAESKKFLTVKLSFQNGFYKDLKHDFVQYFGKSIKSSPVHGKLMDSGFDLAFKKSIEPSLIRKIRAEMSEQAELASIEVFAMNLKQLLMESPLRGQTVLGIDPGFGHGCKMAAVSEHGELLEVRTMYPHAKHSKHHDNASRILVSMVKEHWCSVIALGNGTACRETEAFLTKLIASGAFKPVDVSYKIVNEAGASVYSCSNVAKEEFPDIDINQISAISIARRLQDPLAELVKVEPKHLGVGMYQHDLPEKQLNLTLNEVVVESVSFVGVDINTASLCLLKKVAGLTDARAKNILEWRRDNIAFTNRKQLMDVRGIGPKTFEQCAGFIRILPETCQLLRKNEPLNYLDQTWIHPDSYSVAEKFLKMIGCSANMIGDEKFIKKVENAAGLGYEALAKKFNTEVSTMEIIVTGLTAKKNHDIRLKDESPLFRKKITGIEDLKPGVTLRGEVRNVTHFGAFVDVGCSRDGLLLMRFMKGRTLIIGQRIQVKVHEVDLERNRFTLKLDE